MLAWRISGELLRRKSLPPNCKMTILVPSGTALDSRASMPPVVSPFMPAFVTRRLDPRACSIACSCAGKDSDELTPLPWVLLAPRATTCADADPISAKNRNIAAGIFPRSCMINSIPAWKKHDSMAKTRSFLTASARLEPTPSPCACRGFRRPIVRSAPVACSPGH
jgi:hypothetical protein